MWQLLAAVMFLCYPFVHLLLAGPCRKEGSRVHERISPISAAVSPSHHTQFLSIPGNVVMFRAMSSSYKGHLKKEFMQIALGRLQIQKSRFFFPLRNQQLFVLFEYMTKGIGDTHCTHF